MIFTKEQFEAIAYIFERENGNKHSDYELAVIANSGFSKLEPALLERQILDGFANGIYDDSIDRGSAYWALGKRFNLDLIPTFQKWLRKEFEKKEAQAVYQLLINLSNMEEPVFNPDRDGGSASWETELNMRDAEEYLKKNDT